MVTLNGYIVSSVGKISIDTFFKSIACNDVTLYNEKTKNVMKISFRTNFFYDSSVFEESCFQFENESFFDGDIEYEFKHITYNETSLLENIIFNKLHDVYAEKLNHNFEFCSRDEYIVLRQDETLKSDF